MRWAHSDRLRRRPPTMTSMATSTILHGSGASPSPATADLNQGGDQRRGRRSNALATSSSATANMAWDNTNPRSIAGGWSATRSR
jgi:hypothetical protein